MASTVPAAGTGTATAATRLKIHSCRTKENPEHGIDATEQLGRHGSSSQIMGRVEDTFSLCWLEGFLEGDSHR